MRHKIFFALLLLICSYEVGAANPAPVSGKQWSNNVENGTSTVVTITSPTSGAGKMLVFSTMYTGASDTILCQTSGGTSVTVTARVSPPAATHTVGVAIWDITYASAPTSVTVTNQTNGFYATAAVTEVSDYDSFDVASSAVNTGTGSNATATNLPDTTDAQGAVFGVWTQEDFPGVDVEAGATWTELFDLDNNNDASTLHVQYKSTSSGSNDPVWAHSSATYRAAAVGLKGVASGGSSSVPKIIQQH